MTESPEQEREYIVRTTVTYERHVHGRNATEVARAIEEDPAGDGEYIDSQIATVRYATDKELVDRLPRCMECNHLLSDHTGRCALIDGKLAFPWRDRERIEAAGLQRACNNVLCRCGAPVGDPTIDQPHPDDLTDSALDAATEAYMNSHDENVDDTEAWNKAREVVRALISEGTWVL